MERDKLEVLLEPFSVVELAEVVNKLEDLGETGQEDENTFFLVRIVVESVKSLNGVADDYRSSAHRSLPNLWLLSPTHLGGFVQ